MDIKIVLQEDGKEKDRFHAHECRLSDVFLPPSESGKEQQLCCKTQKSFREAVRDRKGRADGSAEKQTSNTGGDVSGSSSTREQDVHKA
ncbi:hypothetical protein WISP_04704 [Willisornis vidua]|uniref:Uncharacterized protein n=1 Tax=Willisornis vidua TaxID=1566151 RepID=A0ABQ9DXN6_9PASS|nr:hypothetical protein WISP_04704 [Willisornis vidua]